MTISSEKVPETWGSYFYNKCPNLETCLGVGTTAAIGLYSGGTSAIFTALVTRYCTQGIPSQIFHKGLDLFQDKLTSQTPNSRIVFKVIEVTGDSLIIGFTAPEDSFKVAIAAGSGLVTGNCCSTLSSYGLKRYDMKHSISGRVAEFAASVIGGFFAATYTADLLQSHSTSRLQASFNTTSSGTCSFEIPKLDKIKYESGAANYKINSRAVSPHVDSVAPQPTCINGACSRAAPAMKSPVTTIVTSDKDKEDKEERPENKGVPSKIASWFTW